MEDETEKRRECPGCYGNGWIMVEGYPDPEIDECPVCNGKTYISAGMQIYTFYNLRRSRLLEELKYPTPTEFTRIRFPQDYSVHAMIEADSLHEAAKIAADRGVVISSFTVVEQPSGELFAQPQAANYLEH